VFGVEPNFSWFWRPAPYPLGHPIIQLKKARQGNYISLASLLSRGFFFPYPRGHLGCINTHQDCCPAASFTLLVVMKARYHDLGELSN